MNEAKYRAIVEAWRREYYSGIDTFDCDDALIRALVDAGCDECAEKDAILCNPEKWMKWCDIRVLEENESLRARIAELERQIREHKCSIPLRWD